MSEEKFWLIFWGMAFASLTACSVLEPKREESSVACVKAGGTWHNLACRKLEPTSNTSSRSE